MSIVNTSGRVTADEFLVHAAATGTSELVRGEIRMMSPAGGAHGIIVLNLVRALDAFVEEHRLGQCFADGTGFLLPGLGDTVRSPDVAFVRAGQLPDQGLGRGWVRVAPDLAVEVLSPDERTTELEEKLSDYWAAGTRLAWVVDPAWRGVTVRSPSGAQRRLSESETLDGGDVLPGFSLPVSRLFERVAR
ncbi:MAG: Uma2 family endonuclease [Gemmatimonadaceae bacterium]